MSTTTAETPVKTRGLTRLDEGQKATVEANAGLVYAIARAMKDCRLPEDDRVQAGMLGLMRASQLFDPSFGTRFSTFASYHIKTRIRRAEHYDTTIRTPTWTSYKTAEKASTQRLMVLAGVARATASIESFATDPTMVDADPAARMAKAEAADLVNRSLAALSAPLQRVLVARLLDGETLEQVSRREGVTREAVRLRERAAIEKLHTKLASEFMEGN